MQWTKNLVTGLAAAVLMTAMGAAPAQENADAKFLTDTIRANLAEIKMGQLAKQRGQSERVRDYGETLREDHSATLEKTADLAKSFKVTVPTDTTPEAKQHYDALAKLSGSAFDQAFVSHMMSAHQEAIGKFTKQAEGGGDKEVAELAKDTLPTLREHLATAQSLQARPGG